jgi:GNAT superfamily N-acetyltransferase
MIHDRQYSIRAIQKQEAAHAHLFIKENADGQTAWSLQNCYHHASGIFVCEHEGKWFGLIASYLSPANKGTAVIETMVVAETYRQQGIGTLLANYALAYWKHQCVFHISYMPEDASAAATHMLQKFNFKIVEKDGFKVFLLKQLPDKICMHNRVMRPSMNTINGEVGEDTLFEYFQKDDVIWGTYSGGTVVRGVLLGKMARNGNIDFEYQQISVNGDIYTGHSKSSTEFLNDGRIVLYEDWEWTGNRSGGGRSVIEEIKEP